MLKKRKTIERIIPDNPIFSRYEGLCNVCKDSYSPGELISPFFESNKNYWRHTACLQLWFITFKFAGNCKACNGEIEVGVKGYWSKHNGVWCKPCGERLLPKVSIVSSSYQEEYFDKLRKAI